MKNAALIILLIACAVLGAGWFLSARAHAATQERLEQIADERAALELEKAGYVSAFAAVRDGLLARDSAARALENALRASETRRYARAEVVTESRIDTVFVGTEQPDSHVVTASIDIEPFKGTLQFQPPLTFGLNLVCSPRLEQYVMQSASDRLLLGVRALSPRTEVRVEAFDATPYLRQQEKGSISLLERALHLAGGAALWELVR